jgi:hypothetical protein
MVFYLFLCVLNGIKVNILIKNMRQLSNFVHCVLTLRTEAGLF